jgi:hypothetical protein
MMMMIMMMMFWYVTRMKNFFFLLKAVVTSRLKEVQEENGLLNAKAASLEARNLSATEQEKQLGQLIIITSNTKPLSQNWKSS